MKSKRDRYKAQSTKTDQERSIFSDDFCIWEADFVPVVFSERRRMSGNNEGSREANAVW